MLYIDHLPSGLVAELLLADIEIIPNKVEIPELESSLDPIVEKLLMIFKEQLTDWYIIKDPFKNHESRIKWITEMEERFGGTFSNFYERNKLRGNWRAIVHLALDTIGVHTNDETALRLSKELYVGYDAYEKMTLEQRIALVHQIESAVVDYLHKFAPSYTFPRN